MMKKIRILASITVFNVIVLIANLCIAFFSNPTPTQPSVKNDSFNVNKSYFKTSDEKIASYRMTHITIYHPTDYETQPRDSIILQNLINLDCADVTHNWSYDSINKNHKAFQNKISERIQKSLQNLSISCDSITCFFGQK